MNEQIKILVSRAPALTPGMMETVQKAESPLILVPESFTLAAERALVRASARKGLIGTQVFSPTSLVREIKERAGFPDKKVITGDGRHMILSLLLLKNKDRLLFYRENAAQSGMAEKLAAQIDDLADAGMDCASLLEASRDMKQSTMYKCRDIALIWEEYLKILDAGFIDQALAWQAALARLERSGLMQDQDLIIYGFDRINMDLTRLIAASYPLARSITVGLVGPTGCPDDHIFELACHSVGRFVRRITGPEFSLPVSVEKYPPEQTDAAGESQNPSSPGGQKTKDLPAGQKPDDLSTDPGIRYLERHIYALEKSREKIPDLSAVQVYYASNTTVECLHTAQTLIEWHRAGIPWHEMAVAVCDDSTIPAMLPLILASSGVPCALRGGVPMLRSEYARFFLAAVRTLRSGFKQEDVLRLVKSGFMVPDEEAAMDLENYVREHGIDRGRWLKPFKGDDEKTLRLEEIRERLTVPLVKLRKALGAQGCTGRDAARALFGYILDTGAYETLLEREEELLAGGMLFAADRNRQVWTAVNEQLDQLASFAPDDHLTLTQLCLMLEASVSARKIKSLPQVADSVIISSPDMFFSSGIRALAMVGMQDMPASPPSALLTAAECSRLAKAGSGGREDSGIGMTRSEAAARARQDIYQALSCAGSRLMVSASAARTDGKVLTASQVYNRISLLVGAQHPENVSGGLTADNLAPFSPQFALERLAVRLREAGSDDHAFLTGNDPKDAAWKDALSFLYHSSDWHDQMQSILDALHVRLRSPGIAPEQAALLYRPERMSISEIQTAATCQYLAFLTYALRVRPRRDFAFEVDSQGTFSHLVLQRFFEEAMKEPGYPVLNDSLISRLLDKILIEATGEWRDGPLGKSRSARYRGGEIVRTVRTAVHTLAGALSTQPHFSPIGMEIGFGDSLSTSPLSLPAVELSLQSGQKISVSGIIDRLDTVDLGDRKAVLVYDYKSSVKDVHAQSLTEGVQIQLPIYLMAVRAGMPDYMLAGALYQPVRQVLVSAPDDQTQTISEGIGKELCSRGIFLDDEEIKRASAPLKVPRRSAVKNDILGALTREELEDVIDQGADSARRIITRMLSGATTPNPVQDGMNPPCSYCRMKDACPLDSRLPGGRVRKLDHVRDNPAGET